MYLNPFLRTTSSSPLISRIKASMGTFEGHLVPGVGLFLLGLWHMFNTIKDYNLQGPTNFISRFNYPFKTPVFMIRHSELIIILFFSIFAILVQFFDYPFFHFSLKLHNLEHATMFFHVVIFSGFTLFVEVTRLSNNLCAISKILAVSVFSQELFLIHYHSTDHVGLEGHYHFLLQLVVSLSLLASLSSTSFPSSFLSALVLAISVVFQGCWFIIMGFMLWVPKFLPRGCFVRTMVGGADVGVTCQTNETEMRARALANMQFSWIFGGIMVFTCFLCLLFAKNFDKPRAQSGEYEKL